MCAYHVTATDALPPSWNLFRHGLKEAWHASVKERWWERIRNQFSNSVERKKDEERRRRRADRSVAELVVKSPQLDRSGWIHAVVIAEQAAALTPPPAPFNSEAASAWIFAQNAAQDVLALANTLISDPIKWDGSSMRVGNGQHRLVVAKTLKVPRILYWDSSK